MPDRLFKLLEACTDARDRFRAVGNLVSAVTELHDLLTQTVAHLAEAATPRSPTPATGAEVLSAFEGIEPRLLSDPELADLARQTRTYPGVSWRASVVNGLLGHIAVITAERDTFKAHRDKLNHEVGELHAFDPRPFEQRRHNFPLPPGFTMSTMPDGSPVIEGIETGCEVDPPQAHPPPTPPKVET